MSKFDTQIQIEEIADEQEQVLYRTGGTTTCECCGTEIPANQIVLDKFCKEVCGWCAAGK